MTPAISHLKKKQIPFQTHQYSHDVNHQSYGIEAAEKLLVGPERIFKTLVLETDNNLLIVAIIPVLKHLNLKAIAAFIKAKKVKMADVKRVESTTGYILGGVSPLGQKKQLKTIIDDSAQPFTTVFVSGGKRGLEIELSPQDLAQLTRASFTTIISE
jgi:Cys-tRNA(Pro)/Cys-tRNA(Cys) deacylase